MRRRRWTRRAPGRAACLEAACVLPGELSPLIASLATQTWKGENGDICVSSKKIRITTLKKKGSPGVRECVRDSRAGLDEA